MSIITAKTVLIVFIILLLISAIRTILLFHKIENGQAHGLQDHILSGPIGWVLIHLFCVIEKLKKNREN